MEIHVDMEGALSVWRDPYEWVDPFEAEEWALRYAETRQRMERELDEQRRDFARVEAHLNGVINAQQERILKLAPLILNRPILPMPGETIRHIDGDPLNNNPENPRKTDPGASDR